MLGGTIRSPKLYCDRLTGNSRRLPAICTSQYEAPRSCRQTCNVRRSEDMGLLYSSSRDSVSKGDVLTVSELQEGAFSPELTVPLIGKPRSSQMAPSEAGTVEYASRASSSDLAAELSASKPHQRVRRRRLHDPVPQYNFSKVLFPMAC